MALNRSGRSFIRISFRPLDFVLQDRTFELATKSRSKINRHHFKQKQYRYFPAHPSFKPCLFLFQGKDGSRKASAPSREKIIAENFQPSHALGFFHVLNAMIFSAVHDMPFSASLLFLDGLPFSAVQVGGKGRKQAGKIASAVWFCPCSCGKPSEYSP